MVTANFSTKSGFLLNRCILNRGTTVLAIGGYRSGTKVNDVEVYDEEQDKWTNFHPMIFRRFEHVAVVIKGKDNVRALKRHRAFKK